MGKSLIFKIIEVIITAIIGGFIAVYVFGTAKLEYKNGFKDGYFNIPQKAPDDLIIQYKGKKIENISVFDFTIYNRTFKDLKDVIIYFKLSAKDEKQIPQVISKGIYPPLNLPEKIGIEEIKQTSENLYAYKLDVVKQTGSDKYYHARFIFEGSNTAAISISIPKNAGIDIVEYSNWREYLLLISILVMIFLIMVTSASLFDGWQNKKIWSKRIDRLNKVLVESSINNTHFKCFIDKYEDEFKPKTPYFYKKLILLINKIKHNK